MADFRKWLLAFAAIALLLSTGLPVMAQGSGLSQGGNMTCTATSVPPLVRSEGYTEQVGDVVLNCTGGTPTLAGHAVPTSVVRVGLNTNITSRINPNNGTTASAGGGPYTPTEALLLIDEPFPANPNPSSAQAAANSPAFKFCPELTGTDASHCQVLGTSGATSPYTAYNAYQGVLASFTPSAGNLGPCNTGVGQLAGCNAIDFLGIPIDPPGTNLTRVIRITNLRADAVTRFGGAIGQAGGPIPIVATVSIGGSQQVAVTNPTLDVAFVVRSLITSLTGSQNTQCNLPNAATLDISEGFSYAFKTRYPGGSAAAYQNVPGYSYFTESGFMLPASGGAAGTGTGDIGVADSGTRFIIRIHNLQNGTSFTFPGSVGSTGTSGLIRTVTGTDANGAGGSISGAAVTITGSYAGGTTATDDFVVYEVVAADPNQVEAFHINTGFTYTPNVQQNIPYVTPAGTTDLLSATGGASNMNVWYAPSLPSGGTAVSNPAKTTDWNQPQGPYTSHSYEWIPRFAPGPTLGNFITITPCKCDLLFPYVTNQQGFDTGIAIANTSMDPFGAKVTTDQGTGGAVNLYFYGNSTPGNTATFAVPEAAATKQIVVPPGCVYAFEMTTQLTVAQTLAGCDTKQTGSGGSANGNYLINPGATATPLRGFQGYMIAVANFQYCHGVAFLVGPAGGQGATYEAIELDTPFWAMGMGITGSVSNSGVLTGTVTAPVQRSGQYGESQAH
ncbi:MAG TPA: hypothetical protein VFA04_10245 [Bryobacteraceae bacterium]|nr:hypothetical protein [Bryobacteraceae bacterium]